MQTPITPETPAGAIAAAIIAALPADLQPVAHVEMRGIHGELLGFGRTPHDTPEAARMRAARWDGEPVTIGLRGIAVYPVRKLELRPAPAPAPAGDWRVAWMEPPSGAGTWPPHLDREELIRGIETATGVPVGKLGTLAEVFVHEDHWM